MLFTKYSVLSVDWARKVNIHRTGHGYRASFIAARMYKSVGLHVFGIKSEFSSAIFSRSYRQSGVYCVAFLSVLTLTAKI